MTRGGQRAPAAAGPARAVLLADAQALDQLGVAIAVLALQVVEQTPALANELQQPAARVMIFRVGLEMFGQVVDALAEERDLDLGRSGVLSVGLVAADDVGLAILGQSQCHLHARLRLRRRNVAAPSRRRSFVSGSPEPARPCGEVAIPSDSVSYTSTRTGCKSPPGPASASPSNPPRSSSRRIRPAVSGPS